jgi:hypothetical protein
LSLFKVRINIIRGEKMKNKFNLIYEEMVTVTDLLKDCEVIYHPGDYDNPEKCSGCGCDIIDKAYKLDNRNMCENCFNLFIKKPRKIGNKPLLKEGGHAFNDVGPIKRENIKLTIDKLNEMVFIPLNIPESMWTAEIGSVGKKAESGDIDIAINLNDIAKLFEVESINEAKQIIIDQLNSVGIENRKVGVNIHMKFPMEGSQLGEFVQIDFFPSSDLEYSKIQKFSPAENESKYKGVHRGNTFASLIKAISMSIAEDAIDDEKNEYIAPDGRKYPAIRFQHISMLDDGFYNVTKTFKGKKGLLKKPTKDDSKNRFITKNFQEILDMLFGEGKYTLSDINSFESIWNNILMDPSFPYQDRIDEIVTSLYELFKNDDKNVIPDEISNYMEEHALPM